MVPMKPEIRAKVRRVFWWIGHGLLLAVGGFFLLALIIGSLIAIPEADRAIRSATRLEAPTALPENEGKVVIIEGNLTMLEPAFDPKLAITFDSPMVVRHSQSYRRKGKYSIGKRWHNVGEITLVGRASVGDFEIDPAILENLPAEADIHDLDGRSAGTIYTVTDPDYGWTYASSDDIREVREGWFESGGHFWRYRYTTPAPEGEAITVTLVGIQENGRLTLCDDIDDTCAYLGSVSQPEIRSDLLGSEWVNVAVCLVISAICLFFGFKGILYLKPKH